MGERVEMGVGDKNRAGLSAWHNYVGKRIEERVKVTLRGTYP